jgi:hypothetical protein
MFMPLSSKTGKYPVACEKLLSPDEPERGAYFPDDVMDGLLAATHGRNVPAFARTELSTGRAIPPEESKKLIIKALGNFYPPLGEKAGAFFAAGFDASVEHPHIEKQITQSSSRWQIAFVPRGKTRTQNTVPADSPANPNPRSVIQYDYDNSINSTVYIGHELGHGIADELIRGKDNKKFGDNPLNLDELQAYVSQSIVYDYLRHNPDHHIAQAAERHFQATLAQHIHYLRGETGNPHLRGASFILGRGIEQYLAQLPKAKRGELLDTVFGKNGPTDIIDILGCMGIKDKTGVQAMAKKVMAELTPASPPQSKPAVKVTLSRSASTPT